MSWEPEEATSVVVQQLSNSTNAVPLCPLTNHACVKHTYPCSAERTRLENEGTNSAHR